MAVAIKAAYGATPTYSSDLASGQFKFRSDDDPTNTDNTAPILKPDSGTYYSYWVHLCLEFTGTFTQYTNVKLYSDGTNSWGTGVDILVGLRDSGDAGCPSETERTGMTTIKVRQAPQVRYSPTLLQARSIWTAIHTQAMETKVILRCCSWRLTIRQRLVCCPVRT